MPLGILILGWIVLATVFPLTAVWVVGSGPGGGQTGLGILMWISFVAWYVIGRKYVRSRPRS
jgi:hypothetical protein